ncbi:hypothetical protein MY494_04930 [Synechococcus sp. A10-1-5-1]|uniref:hypothetical protein n=1 Tax=Synechococcus sp. A10-1-5-1 TaxID=2936507 RepID=UPI002000FEA5|nr:hypothetical protein [Synechococcus sp. A10-1-5-1]UPM51114.1 hypothetical protein MY494_04930 [Synechococcus sp. A10-1-5-1]
MLRPSTRSWRNFAIKIALFWFAKLWICQIDVTRPICHIVERGFLPCLMSFAVMDFLLLPWLRGRR